LSIALYISPYEKDSDIDELNNNGVSSMNNNDALFSYILSGLVLNKDTKHIALPIINLDFPNASHFAELNLNHYPFVTK
jgi:hypothetical protein